MATSYYPPTKNIFTVKQVKPPKFPSTGYNVAAGRGDMGGLRSNPANQSGVRAPTVGMPPEASPSSLLGLASNTTNPLMARAMNIQTSITPEAVYSPWMTQAAVNTAVARQHQLSDPRQLMKRTDRPGSSRGAGALLAAIPGMAEGDLGERRARAEIPLEDFFANAGNILRGQTGRDREALGYANLGARLLGNEIDTQNAAAGLGNDREDIVLRMIAQLFGG